jgi:predicted nucleic acid-binding protein
VNSVFGDTVYFLALVNARDQLHAQAKELSRQPPGSLVTTEWVLTEVGDALSAPGARERFTALLGTLQRQADVEIVPANHDLFAKGCAVFGERPDKAWSLTDCLSFAVMRERAIGSALTADHHFVQAGFNVLMRI